MNWLAEKIGTSVNSLLASTLTLLIFFVLVGVAGWYLMHKRVPAYAVGGFLIAAFYFLAVNTKNNGGSEGDKVFDGNINELMAGSSGVYGPGLLNALRRFNSGDLNLDEN